MIETMRDFFTLVGISTIGVLIYCLCRFWWEKWGYYWFHIHKHSYQIHYVATMHHMERDCDDVKICLKCEKCGKTKEFRFWNDRIKIQTVWEEEE